MEDRARAAAVAIVIRPGAMRSRRLEEEEKKEEEEVQTLTSWRCGDGW
jgi:hypothetical protein